MQRVKISARVRPELVAELDRRARERGVSRSVALEQALEAYGRRIDRAPVTSAYEGSLEGMGRPSTATPALAVGAGSGPDPAVLRAVLG